MRLKLDENLDARLAVLLREAGHQARTVKESTVWWISYRARGKRIRESFGSTLKRQAREVLNKRLGEVSQGRAVFPKRSLTLDYWR
jgi:hypothetical protein